MQRLMLIIILLVLPLLIIKCTYFVDCFQFYMEAQTIKVLRKGLGFRVFLKARSQNSGKDSICVIHIYIDTENFI